MIKFVFLLLSTMAVAEQGVTIEDVEETNINIQEEAKPKKKKGRKLTDEEVRQKREAKQAKQRTLESCFSLTKAYYQTYKQKFEQYANEHESTQLDGTKPEHQQIIKYNKNMLVQKINAGMILQC